MFPKAVRDAGGDIQLSALPPGGDIEPSAIGQGEDPCPVAVTAGSRLQAKLRRHRVRECSLFRVHAVYCQTRHHKGRKCSP